MYFGYISIPKFYFLHSGVVSRSKADSQPVCHREYIETSLCSSNHLLSPFVSNINNTKGKWWLYWELSTYQALYYSPYIELYLRLGKMYLHLLIFNSRENNTRSIIFLKVIEIPNAFSSWPCSTVYAHKSFPLKALPGDTMLSYFVPCSFPQRARTYFLYFVKSTILIAR